MYCLYFVVVAMYFCCYVAAVLYIYVIIGVTSSFPYGENSVVGWDVLSPVLPVCLD